MGIIHTRIPGKNFHFHSKILIQFRMLLMETFDRRNESIFQYKVVSNIFHHLIISYLILRWIQKASI